MKIGDRDAQWLVNYFIDMRDRSTVKGIFEIFSKISLVLFFII